jgi:hypothetical protein
MRDDLGNFRRLHAIVERQFQMVRHFGALVPRDQRRDRDEAPVARAILLSRLRTKPSIYDKSAANLVCAMCSEAASGGRGNVSGAQLIDSETGRHLWADRFDQDTSGFFELQDAITIELARALDVQLVGAESRRSERSPNPDALDLVMRARAYTYRGASREILPPRFSFTNRRCNSHPMMFRHFQGWRMRLQRIS